MYLIAYYNRLMIKDFFGNDASILLKKKLFLLDMDGTIYNENILFDGSKEFIEYVNSRGKAVFLTNNSSKSSKAYVEKLIKMGIEANEEDIFSSIDATIIMLKEKYPNLKDDPNLEKKKVLRYEDNKQD